MTFRVRLFSSLLAAVVALGVMLLALYGVTHRHGVSERLESTIALRHLKELDARWESDVMRSRLGIDHDYDVLSAELAGQKAQLDAFDASTRGWSAPEAVKDRSTRLRASIDDKADLVEQFKTSNSVLRNSLAFLPIAAEDAQQALDGSLARRPSQASLDVEKLLLASLLYSQHATDELGTEIHAGLRRIAARQPRLASPVAQRLATLTAHVVTVMREQTVTEELIRQIEAAPTRTIIEALLDVLNEEQRRAESGLQRQIGVLLSLSVALMGLLVLAAAKLSGTQAQVMRVNRELQESNQGLERRVQARTEELRRAQSGLLDAARQAGMAEQRRAQVLMQAIAEGSDDAIFAKDRDGRYVLCNLAASRALGKPVDQILGRTDTELFSPEKALEIMVHDARVIADGRNIAYDQDLTTADGPATFMVTAGPLNDEAGQVVGTFGISRDITARKRSESELLRQRAELQAQNEQLALHRQVLDAISEHVLVKGPNSQVIWANRAVRDFYGLDDDGLALGGAPDRQVQANLLDAQVFATAQPLEALDESVTRFDGQVQYWHTAMSPLFDGNGQVVATVGVSRDVSAQKLAQQRLQVAEAFRAAVLDSVGTQIAVLDRAGIIVAVNEPWRRFARENGVEPGRDAPGTGVGHSYLDVCSAAVDTPEGSDATQADQGIRAVLEGRRTDFTLEYPCDSPLERRWFRMTVTPLDAAGGGVVVGHIDISELKRAEAALRANEILLEKTGRIAGVGGWSFDLATRQVEWTTQTCRIYDLEPGHRPSLEESVGYYAPEAIPVVEAALRHSITSAEGFDLELPLITALGRNIWVRAVGEVEFERGRAVRLLGALQDITARRTLEGDLRRSNARLETALRDARVLQDTLKLHAIVSVADPCGRIVEVNDAFCEISGYSRDELVGQDHRIVNSGVQTREFWSAMWACIAGGTPWRGEVCNRAKDGSLYWVDTFIAPYVGDDGQVEKYVSIRTDITPRKTAEADAKHGADLLRGAIDAIDEAFVLFDPNDRLVLCNDKYRELFAAAQHLVVPGATFAELITQGYARGMYARSDEQGDAWVAEHIAAHHQANITRVQRLADGRILRSLDRRLPDGHTVGFRVDITEIAQATEAAQAAAVAKGQFLATMSHEIRTPMNAILGMLTLLRKTSLSLRQADYANKAEGAARSLLGLLNEILDFSKAEAGKLTLDPQPFSVEQMLRDVSVIQTATIGSKPVELLFDIDPALPNRLVGDSMRLRQVLVNLISNAIKFTAQGEVVFSMKVLAHEASQVTLEIAVRDTGIGIAPENQARIFNAFTQAEASTTRRFGGTGLGLAISQRLVTLMGGTLALESELGRGSRFHFTVTLPSMVDGTPAAPSSLRVLVVDDNPTARDVLCRMCRSLGWNAAMADNGEQALALMQEQAAAGISCDAVFVDWQMPRLDGWQTARRIRELRLPGIAPLVVMVSASDETAALQRTEAERALIDGYLVKPVTASMLVDAVGDARAGLVTQARALPTRTSRRLIGLRVLLAEDNPNNQQVARELLEDEGAVVQIAHHGKEAVEAVAAAAVPFDVVLMDLQMPTLDGFGATRQIRRELGLTSLPIVAMTANALSSDREACLDAGMNDHVGKPFDLDHLVAVLCRQTGHDPDRHGGVMSVQEADAELPARLSAAAAMAGVDLQAALHRLGGKREIYWRMLSGFVVDLATMPAQLRCQPEQAPPWPAARLLHTLKGLAATLGAHALAAQAAQAEKLLEGTLGPAAPAEAIRCACAAIAEALPGLDALQRALQEEASARDSDRSAAATSVDVAILDPALRALAEHLRQADMAAIDAMEDLMQKFGNTPGIRLKPLDEAITTLDFSLALRLCLELIEAQPA